MARIFDDRVDAGRQLAAAVRAASSGWAPLPTVVLGLPRGGVPVARVVADAIGAPLDVIAVRKLGAPRHPEFAVGAIGEGGVRVVDDDSVRLTGLDEGELAVVEAHERTELARRLSVYRNGRPPVGLDGVRAIVVDDGVATGATAAVACRAARLRGAAEVVLAVPVAPHDWVDRLGAEADAFVAVSTPRDFWAVGQWYRHFDQTGDDEVIGDLAPRAGDVEHS